VLVVDFVLVDVAKPHLWENVAPAPVAAAHVLVVGMTVETDLVAMKTVV
jgi:hypothetical protein